ncbi:MAG: hypothetical protein LRY46_02770 [Candidatus Pacebacteria bacterium]|nr:hypothetical protein [Candidatus Paceibacterota bacterium]
MSHNHTYNLMNQLTQEMKSLWRIEKHYIPEAQTDQERELFEDMARVKKGAYRSARAIGCTNPWGRTQLKYYTYTKLTAMVSFVFSRGYVQYSSGALYYLNKIITCSR